MEKIVLCGASGLIGTPLIKKLDEKYQLVLLRRKLPANMTANDAREVLWNPPYSGDWTKRLEGAAAVINLSGDGIAESRWTAAKKRVMRDSRLNTVKALVDAISKAKNKPKCLISASALGLYGPQDSSRLDESAGAGSGFLAELCREWENAAKSVESMGVRLVLLRTGIVLAKEGGALQKMKAPFTMYIGGPLGSGKQFMSWIHLDDEVNAIIKCLEDSSIRGPVNLTAPNAVSNKEFSQALARQLKRPCGLPVPGLALKLLAGEMAEMLLTGQNVYPKRLLDAGFKFKYETLEPALQDLL